MKKYLMIFVFVGFGAYAYNAYKQANKSNVNLKK